MIREITLFAKSFIEKLRRDRVYNYAASSAFFIILSVFPFLILLITLIQYTPITQDFLMGLLEDLVQDPLYTILAQILEEIYTTTAGAGVVLVSALGGLWSSSKGIMSLIRGFNSCFNINDRRNYFQLRLLSCVYTVIMLIVLVFSLVLMVFGKTFYNLMHKYSVPLYTVLRFILKNSMIISFFILILLFAVMYTFLPAKKNKFLYMLPGAVLAALAWLILSKILGLYVNISPSFSYTYGSLTSFIMVMLYLYLGMYIIFLGAEVNQFFKLWLERLVLKRRRQKALKYDRKMFEKQQRAEAKRLKRGETKAAPENEELK